MNPVILLTLLGSKFSRALDCKATHVQMYPDWHSKGSVVVWGLPETVLDLGVIEDTDDGSSMTCIDYPESIEDDGSSMTCWGDGIHKHCEHNRKVPAARTIVGRPCSAVDTTTKVGAKS